MEISLKLPSTVVRVRDTQNSKGNPVTVLSIFGEDVAYYVGNPHDTYALSNEDWEDIALGQMARFFARAFVEKNSEEWSLENPTGREISKAGPIEFVREEY